MGRSVTCTLVCCLAALGCGGGGGGGGGGGSLSPIAAVASYAPASVARASSYSWTQVYAPGAGTISALGVAPSVTSLFAALTPANRVDRIDATGFTTESQFPDAPSGFGSDGTNLWVATSGPVAMSAETFRRDPAALTWSLDLTGRLESCVLATFMGNLYALQGEPGSDGVLSQLSTTWIDVASLPSCVPAAGVEFRGELWVGGRSSTTSAPELLHGVTSFTNVIVPAMVGPGAQGSVSALGVLGNALFAGLEIQDAKTGAVQGGAVYYVGASGPVSILSLQGEAPIGFADLDGTIYVATTKGRILWLDTMGRFQPEASLPTSSGATALVVYQGTLAVAIATPSGPVVVTRQAVSIAPPTLPPGSPMPPPSPSPSPFPTLPAPPTGNPNAVSVNGVSPNTGYVAGYWSVIITGNNFVSLTSVTVGGQPLLNLNYSSNEIQGRIPPGTAPGPVALQIVSTVNGMVTMPNAITFNAADPAAPSYQTAVLPIITQVCNSCHNSPNRVPLSPYATIMNGTVGGVGLVDPGNANATSYLCDKIDSSIGSGTATMANYVTAAQRSTIEAWIQGGAKP